MDHQRARFLLVKLGINIAITKSIKKVNILEMKIKRTKSK